MSKRIIALALCAGMLLLGGCASEGAAGTSGGTTNNNGQESNSPSASGQVAADTRTSFEKLFDDGPLLVQNADELWGYIDSTGKYVIEPQFTSAYEFQDNGLAAVMDNVTGLWGYINTSGEYVIEPAFARVSSNGFAENGLAAVFDAESGLGGYINESGEYVIPPEHYYALGDFSDGLAVAGERGYQYYIDETGEVQFSLIFQEAYDFVDGWAAVNHRGLPGYLNRSGEFHAIRGAQDVMGFYDGRAFVKMSNGKYKLIDENLEYVTDTEFDSVPNYSSLGGGKGAAIWQDGICVVAFYESTGESSGYRYVAINTEGEILFPTNGQEFTGINNFTDGYAIARDAESGKCGIIDDKGNWTLAPQYDYSGSTISQGICLFADADGVNFVNGKYINVQGEVVLENVNPDVEFLGNYRDIIQVKMKEKDPNTGLDRISFVDHDGNLITDLTFDYAKDFTFDCSYAEVLIDGLWGIIDGEGNWLLEPEFLSIGR